MRHIEVRELWLQKEVLKGVVQVVKVPGEQNPADLMTKFLSKADIESRLQRMNVGALRGNDVKAEKRVPPEVKKSEKLIDDRWADAGGGGGGEEDEAAETLAWWLHGSAGGYRGRG